MPSARFAAALLAGSLLAAPSRGDHLQEIGDRHLQTVAVSIEGPLEAEPGSCLVSVDRLVGKSRSAGPEEFPCEVAASGLALDDHATYVVKARVPGFWFPEVLVDPKLQRTVSLPAYSVTPRKVALRSEDGSALQGRLLVTASIPRRPGEQELEGPVDCDGPPSDLTCRLPETQATIRFAIQGFMPHYFIDRLPSGAETDIALRQGASVAFWLTASNRREFEGITAMLEPAISPPLRLLGIRGLGAFPSTAATADAPEAMAFCQLGPLPKGEFDLRIVAASGAVTDVRSVRLDENREVRVSPLSLEGPFQVEVLMSPKSSPWGEDWRGVLTPADDARLQSPAFRRDSQSEVGRLRVADVPAGRYDLRVFDSTGVLGSSLIEVSEGKTHFELALDLIEVMGSVSCGGTSLPSLITFGGAASGRPVQTATNEVGEYVVVLPRSEDPWRIEVSPLEQSSTRADARERVVSPGGAFEELDIELPGTRLEATVVDWEDRPIAGAIVTALSMEGGRNRWTGTSDGKGLALARCLSSGNKLVQAVAESGESEWREIDVEEGTTREIVLRLERFENFEGRVHYRGVGVPAAVVWYRARADGESERSTVAASTRSDGHFDFRAPFGAVDFLVSAPGFALEVSRVILDARRSPLEFELDTIGGRLEVQPPPSLRDLRVIRRGGAEIPLGVLYNDWFSLERLSDGSAGSQPRFFLAPGGYDVCVREPSSLLDCVRLDVIPFEDRILEVARGSDRAVE